MEIKDSSTHSSRSTKLNSANTGWRTANALSLNIVSLRMDKMILDSQMIHFPRISAKLHLARSTLTTRPFHASSGRRPVNASSVRAAHFTMTPTRREDSSTHCLIFPKVLRCHPCLKSSRKLATIINIRIIITATIQQATVTIPLIMPATTHISSIFHRIST